MWERSKGEREAGKRDLPTINLAVRILQEGTDGERAMSTRERMKGQFDQEKGDGFAVLVTLSLSLSFTKRKPFSHAIEPISTFSTYLQTHNRHISKKKKFPFFF